MTGSTSRQMILATFHPRQEYEKAAAQTQDGDEKGSGVEAKIKKRTLPGLLIKGVYKLIDALAKAFDVHLEVPFRHFSLLRGRATVSQHFIFDDDDDDEADLFTSGMVSTPIPLHC